MAVKFAGYPSATIFAEPAGRAAAGQCLWGDHVTVTGPPTGGRVPVRSRRVGWMDESDLQAERLLEMIFVDIGQGDGVLMVTPDDRAILIDAGEGDNMYRFLRWRFGDFKRPFEFPVLIISHGDQDHWGGFGPIFTEPKLRFGTVYHNGMVERGDAAGADSLGSRVTAGGGHWVTGLLGDDDAMRGLLADPAKVGRRRYARLLRDLAESGRVGEFAMLGCPAGAPAHVPGFGPGQPLTMQVLGPVVEETSGKPALRWLGDVAHTKNGHSVVLKIRYGNIDILAGGDLNTPSENLLLAAHTGLRAPAAGPAAEQALIEAARRVFQSDFAKACHHGSADFSQTFLKAINPLATIVSSGDEEAHAHPRPDALGAYGLCGRPPRPLLFSTELFRSTAERIKFPNRYRAELLALVERIVAAGVAGREAEQQRARRLLSEHLVDVDRSVSLYGAINLLTDGRRAIVAYRIEKPASPARKWDIYRFETAPDGTLELAGSP